MRTILQTVEIWSKNKQPCCCTTKQRKSSGMLLPWTNDYSPLAIVATSYPLNCVHACIRLLFKGSYCLVCSLYSNKYGICTSNLLNGKLLHINVCMWNIFLIFRILRTRDPALLKGCDTIVDVGGEYNPATHRYDYHQRWAIHVTIFSHY